MEKAFVKYCMGAFTYGLGRTVAYAPPRKKEEYVTDRVGKTLLFTMLAPWSVPKYIYTDMRNIEHRVRKMPGSIDRYPW
jgi:hypothetical protein